MNIDVQKAFDEIFNSRGQFKDDFCNQNIGYCESTDSGFKLCKHFYTREKMQGSRVLMCSIEITQSALVQSARIRVKPKMTKTEEVAFLLDCYGKWNTDVLSYLTPIVQKCERSESN